MKTRIHHTRFRSMLGMLCFMLTMTQGSRGKAQNLVYNGDMENMLSCPDTTSQLYLAEGWFNANMAKSDYFNACEMSGLVSVPTNFIGTESAHSGSGYVGIYIAEDDGPVYREFIESALQEPLLADHAYALEFYVSVADESSCIPTVICAYLSSAPLTDTVSLGFISGLSLIEQTLCTTPGEMIDEENGWHHVYACFHATGDEAFITIGNNYTEYLAPCINDNGGAHKAYMYVDDISLTPMPIKVVTRDTVICKGATVTVDALAAIEQPLNADPTVVWSDGVSGAVRTLSQEGTYTAMINNGCAVDTFRMQVLWKYDCPEVFYFPNAFSPNNDGLNDRFHITMENITVKQLDVYDRWGALLYTGINDPDGWDGTVHGKAAETGLYMYVIRYYTNISEKEIIKCGGLQLLR